MHEFKAKTMLTSVKTVDTYIFLFKYKNGLRKKSREKKSFSLNGKHLPKFTNWKKPLMIENTIIYLIYSVGEFYCVRIDSFVLLLRKKSILFTLYLKIYSVFSRWYNNVFQPYSIYLTEAQPTSLILLSILEIPTGIIYHLLLRKTYQLSRITSYFQRERVFKL